MPDFLLRRAMRRLLAQRAAEASACCNWSGCRHGRPGARVCRPRRRCRCWPCCAAYCCPAPFQLLPPGRCPRHVADRCHRRGVLPPPAGVSGRAGGHAGGGAGALVKPGHACGDERARHGYPAPPPRPAHASAHAAACAPCDCACRLRRPTSSITNCRLNTSWPCWVRTASEGCVGACAARQQAQLHMPAASPHGCTTTTTTTCKVLILPLRAAKHHPGGGGGSHAAAVLRPRPTGGWAAGAAAARQVAAGRWLRAAPSLPPAHQLLPAAPALPCPPRPARRQVLELGCGWGSWSLFMAAKYPQSRITAVSNSRTQRAFITAEAKCAAAAVCPRSAARRFRLVPRVFRGPSGMHACRPRPRHLSTSPRPAPCPCQQARPDQPDGSDGRPGGLCAAVARHLRPRGQHRVL